VFSTLYVNDSYISRDTMLIIDNGYLLIADDIYDKYTSYMLQHITVISLLYIYHHYTMMMTRASPLTSTDANHPHRRVIHGQYSIDYSIFSSHLTSIHKWKASYKHTSM